MEKMFKILGNCPHTGNAIDSPACRQCKWYFRAGTETFIWCAHESQQALAPETKMKIATTATAEKVKAKSGTKRQSQKKTKTAKRGRPKKNKMKHE